MGTNRLLFHDTQRVFDLENQCPCTQILYITFCLYFLIYATTNICS